MMMPYPYTLNPKKRSEFLPPVIVGSQRRNELAAFPVESRSKDQNKPPVSFMGKENYLP